MRELAERRWPTFVVAAACVGLALANGIDAPPLALAATAGVVALFARVRLLALMLAVGLAGWWWGSARLDALDRSVLATHVGETAPATAVVTGPARRTAFALRVPAEIRRFGHLPVRERVLLQLPAGRAPPQGGILELAASVRPPRTADSGFDERAWLARRGVHVVVHAGTWRVVGRRGGIAGATDALRAHIARALAPALDRERRSVVAGVVLGEDEGLDEELRDAFRASGLYHLLAVSGQNVLFLTLGVMGLASLLAMPRLPAQTLVLAAIGAYVAAVGWQPSVVRAGIAGGLASLAWLVARPRDRWHFLALGALVLLAWMPATLFEPGFQLSFAAVAAIFVVVPRLERVLGGYPLPRPLRGVLAVSVACSAATAPIAWLHFGAVPLYSVPANALAWPVTGGLLGLGLAAAALEPVLPTAAAALNAANGWLAAYLVWCARAVASLPYAQVTSGATLGAGVVAVAAGVAAVRGGRRVRRWSRRGLVAVAAAFALWVAWPDAPPPAPTGLRVTFLDVGQGDAAVLQVAGGAVLVDQGPPEADVAAQLRELGIRALSLLVLTHPQRDHVGGAADVIEGLPVRGVLDPGLPTDSPHHREAVAAARERQVPVILARAGDTYRLGRLLLRVLWPRDAGSAAADPNDRAVVLLASYGDVDLLLTADAEMDVVGRLLRRPVEVLKVAHHGSADDYLQAALRLLRPRVALISVGARNDYGHPRRSTVRALERSPGLDLYRTDRDGHVVLETDGRRMSVRTAR